MSLTEGSKTWVRTAPGAIEAKGTTVIVTRKTMVVRFEIKSGARLALQGPLSVSEHGADDGRSILGFAANLLVLVVKQLLLELAINVELPFNDLVFELKCLTMSPIPEEKSHPTSKSLLQNCSAMLGEE